MLHLHPKSSTAFDLCIDPNSCTYCSVDNGRPCRSCKEFQKFQSSLAQATRDLTWNEHRHKIIALQGRYSGLRGRINDVHDLMNSFPVELRTEIFESYCLLSNKSVKPQVTLLSVCKAWRNLAINNPRLWTVFPALPVSQDPFCVEQVRLWLKYSKQLPISLEFEHRDWLIETDLLLNRYSISFESSPFDGLKWHQKTIACEIMRNKHRIYKINAATLATLQRKIFSPAHEQHTMFPVLSHITLDFLAVYDAVEVLRRCPQVISVTFRRLKGSSERIPERVNYPHLKLLEVGFDEFSNASVFLNSILAPALTEVVYCSAAKTNTIPALEGLFRSSACSLHRLHLTQTKFDHHELLSLLTSLPSLRILEIALRFNPNEDDDNGDTSGQAFETVMVQLLTTNVVDEVGVGGKYTLGEFLPRLEVFNCVGKMQWPWEALVDIPP